MTVKWNWRKRWEFKLTLKCHCTCSSEIGTCMINDAGRQAVHKNQLRYMFLVKCRKTTFNTHVLILTFNAKKKFKKSPKSMTLYLELKIWSVIEIVCLCFQSLRDSLLDHGGKLNSESPPAIVTQVYIIRYALTKFCCPYYWVNFQGEGICITSCYHSSIFFVWFHDRLKSSLYTSYICVLKKNFWMISSTNHSNVYL